jgi:hypothetical protein
MATPPRWGQHVVVDPRGIRGDIKRAIGADLTGRVVSVVPSDSSLVGCVLVAFASGGAAQWVYAEYVSDVPA